MTIGIFPFHHMMRQRSCLTDFQGVLFSSSYLVEVTKLFRFVSLRNLRCFSVLSCPLAAMTNAPGCSDTVCYNNYFVNIDHNPGIVVCGDHNVVQVGIRERNRKASRRVKIKELEASERRRRKRCDRRRLKRLQRNDSSRSTTPTTDEDARNACTLKEIALESESTSFQQALQVFRSCITPLHPLRDNGYWNEFERAAEKLLEEAAGDLTRRIVISLERSVVLSIKKELERSEEMINGAASEISQTSGSIRLLLEVLSKCYMAGTYRKRKMLGNAEECLKIAKKVVSGFPPCLAVAILLYEEGSWQRDFASLLTGSRNELASAKAKEKAKKLMQCCIDLCCRLDREVYVRKQNFAVCKMVSIDLRCESSAARRKSISLKSIEEAKKSLETLQSDYYSQREVQGAKIQRLIAKVDFNYRLEKYEEAEKVGQEALKMAKNLEFNLDVMPLEERLLDIREKMTPASTCQAFRHVPRIIESSSSKNNTPYSSEFEDKL